jgi:hypothetical protein
MSQRNDDPLQLPSFSSKHAKFHLYILTEERDVFGMKKGSQDEDNFTKARSAQAALNMVELSCLALVFFMDARLIV